MILTDNDRRYKLNEFLRYLSFLCDKENQKREWIRNERSKCSSFDDSVRVFFSTGDPILNRYKEYGITEAQYALLKKFRDEFLAFCDERSVPEQFIDTPEWDRIVKMAKEVSKAFDKKYVLDEFLINVFHLQDREYQKRIWIRGEGPECQDFDEAVCYFFDIGDPILNRYKEYGITEAQYALLKKFRDEFQVFCDDHDFPHEFLDTPEWERVIKRAQEVLRAFAMSRASLFAVAKRKWVRAIEAIAYLLGRSLLKDR